MIWVAMALAGGVGAVIRVVATDWGEDRLGPGNGTSLVNLAGTVGLVGAMAVFGSDGLFVVGTGFFGALTTFSTWAVNIAASDQARWRALRSMGWVGLAAVVIGAGGLELFDLT